MNCACENHIKNTEEKRFFIDDNVRVYRKGAWYFIGTITQITSRGIYLDVGNKQCKYFRADEIDEIRDEQ